MRVGSNPPAPLNGAGGGKQTRVDDAATPGRGAPATPGEPMEAPADAPAEGGDDSPPLQPGSPEG